MVHLFVGRCDSEGVGGVHGLPEEGEDIRVHVWPLEDALQAVRDGRINNAASIIALQWLALNRAGCVGYGPEPAARALPGRPGQPAATCEANYARLMRLLPDMREAQASRRVALSEGERLLGVLALEVTEACPYTTTLQVRQELGLPWLPAPRLEVRVYHDARMAEVIGAEQARRLMAIYPYPNQAMHQPDEKNQAQPVPRRVARPLPGLRPRNGAGGPALSGCRQKAS